MKKKIALLAVTAAMGLMSVAAVQAKTVKVTFTAKEVDEILGKLP